MAVKAFCRKPRRTAAEKRVKHNAALGTARQYARFGQLRRERGEMPALVGYSVDMPYVPLVPRGRHEGFIVVAACPRPVDALHLALSGYLAVVFVSRAAPAPVSRRRGGGYGFRNGGGVIVIAL